MSPFEPRLRAAQDGDDDALGEIWRTFNPRLVLFLRGRAGDAAEDLASETWIRAARTLGRFSGSETDFRAWLFTIARRTLIDHYRAAARRPQEHRVGLVVERPETEGDAADLTLAALDTQRALAVVSRLPTDQADVILLRVVAGLDTKRVAQILGKREGAVRVLQHRALRRLAVLLSEPTRDRDVTQ
ncbi:MAG: sigma-70 family RNA polymerase sigma factor [Acidimicrobiia bacterium]|jgi:RNA polymerase sigma-70 factor (ECF subfamily)